MGKLTEEQQVKRRKTNKKILSIFGVIFGVLIIIVIIGGIMGGEGEKGDGTKQTDLQSQPASTIDPILVEFQDDPDFQDWIEIKDKATPFKKDKDWIKSTFEYLRDQNKKWQVVKDKQILLRIDKVFGENGTTPFESDSKLYEEYEKQLDMLLQEFRNKIVKSVFCKRIVSFSIPIDSFKNLASSYGFNAIIEKKGWFCNFWPANKFYKNYEVVNGKNKGKGESFTTEFDQSGNIIFITIPLGERKYDWANLPKDTVEQSQLYKKLLKQNLSNPPAWTSSTLEMIFGQDSKDVINRIHEIGKAGDVELKKMHSGDKFKGFAFWSTSFSVGDKNVTINHLSNATSMSIMMDETKRLWNIYYTIWLKKVI